MAHLINKDALVAEIEKRIKRYDTPTDGMGSNYSHQHECKEILSFIDTLEVKEVDLEKEMDTYFETMQVLEHENIFETTFQNIAKHFFELGLKVNNEKEK